MATQTECFTSGESAKLRKWGGSMNAIISKVPLNSTAPIEGKWYDLGTVSLQIRAMNGETVDFSSYFSIPNINDYKIFAVGAKIGGDFSKGVYFNFFGLSKKLTLHNDSFYYVYGFPADIDNKFGYTADYVSKSSFPANCLVTTNGSYISTTLTVHLLGMR